MSDPLAPARGCLNALLLSIPLWCVMVTVAWAIWGH